MPEEVRTDEETERVKRSEVEKREIGLVFKLNQEGAVDFLPGRIAGVYSFLPLEAEQTGLPFGIFGDFIPQPGRDLINYHALWNRWLCSEITELFKAVVLRNVSSSERWVTVPIRVLENMKQTQGPGEVFWKENLRGPINITFFQKLFTQMQQVT